MCNSKCADVDDRHATSVDLHTNPGAKVEHMQNPTDWTLELEHTDSITR